MLNGINRFNRYMVECEFKPEAISDSESPSFNRYMVECEYRHRVNVDSSFIVLIDTWWNVNVVSAGCVIFKKLVLIDTWWNVNFW